ncbi:hypothetical protein P8605_06670 [Streptomyces sp. T-3]|nr:hypothetical protein [Streptomyces sp. T-3]
MHRRRFISGLAGTAAGAGVLSTVPAAAAEAEGWQQVPAPDGREAAFLHSVAAAGPRRAWAVGVEGVDLYNSVTGTPLAYAWNGTAWSRTDTSHITYNGYLTEVACNESGDAWAIGLDRDTGIWHLYAWDGDTWQPAPFPGQGALDTSLSGILVTPDGDAWAVGTYQNHARTMHWNGRRWRWIRPLPSGNNNTAIGLHRAPCGDIWIYGGGVCARWDGSWHETPMESYPNYVTGLLPVAEDDIWLCGYNWHLSRPPAAQLRHYDGTTWQYVEAPFIGGELTGMTGDKRDRPDRIVGWEYPNWNQAHYLKWEGGTWVSERGPLSQTPVLMQSLTRIPGTRDYWAVGGTTFFPRPPGQVRIERLSV